MIVHEVTTLDGGGWTQASWHEAIGATFGGLMQDVDALGDRTRHRQARVPSDGPRHEVHAREGDAVPTGVVRLHDTKAYGWGTIAA